MGSESCVNPDAIVQNLPGRTTRRGIRAVAVGAEVAVVFAGILLYIWRWQHVYPHFWMVLWAMILASHVLHHDTLRTLGLGTRDFGHCAQWVWNLGLALYIPMLIYGYAHHRFGWVRPTGNALLVLLGYGGWCAFQQYLTQSYFHNRLMLVVHSRHLRCVLVAILFSSTHIPNVVLMVATFIAGFAFAEVFCRYRNIWPLALVQAVGGMLLAAIAPEALIHHMRVGPGYLFYGIH